MKDSGVTDVGGYMDQVIDCLIAKGMTFAAFEAKAKTTSEPVQAAMERELIGRWRKRGGVS